MTKKEYMFNTYNVSSMIQETAKAAFVTPKWERVLNVHFIILHTCMWVGMSSCIHYDNLYLIRMFKNFRVQIKTFLTI